MNLDSIEKCFLLLKTTALAGKKRSVVMEQYLNCLYQFRGRLRMINGTTKENVANMMDFGWFYFDKKKEHSANVRWISQAVEMPNKLTKKLNVVPSLSGIYGQMNLFEGS